MEQIHGNEEIVVTRTSRFETLPEDCISMVISRTSPRDACVVALVSRTLKSAAQSDLVWEMFLPLEYPSLVPRLTNRSSKKEIYLSLANDSVLIENGKMSFWLEKASGKKCYMLSAMELSIAWGDTPAYWQWITDPQSKFENVAELRNVCWFEIRGKINCRILSKETHYSVYLVLKRANNRSHGFDFAPVEATVGFVDKEATKKLVFLESGGGYSGFGYSGISHAAVSRPFRIIRRRFRMIRRRINYIDGDGDGEGEGEKENGGNMDRPKERGDGWSEVELGKVYINNGGSDEIEISVMETKNGYWKSGLIIQGIEIRPDRRN